MTVWQRMHALEALGYQFRLEGDAIKYTAGGLKPSAEESALLDIVRRDRDSAAAYVRERQAGATVVDDGSTYPMFDALALCGAIRDGEAQLFGKVIYHRRAGNVTIRWEPLNGQASAALLDTRREALRNALQSRLCALEVLPDREMTGDEVDRLNAEYGRCKRLLEGHHERKA